MKYKNRYRPIGYAEGPSLDELKLKQHLVAKSFFFSLLEYSFYPSFLTLYMASIFFSKIIKLKQTNFYNNR